MDKPELIDKAIDSIAELISLKEREIELLRELAASLRIRKIFPEAFEEGKNVHLTERGFSNRTYHIVRSDGLECKISKQDYDLIQLSRTRIQRRAS